MMSEINKMLDTIDLESLGLLVIDAQKLFTSDESPLSKKNYDLSNAEKIVPKIQTLIKASRDTSLTIFFTRSIRRTDGRDAPIRVYDIPPKIYRNLDPVCEASNDYLEFVEEINPSSKDYEVTKRGYDAFYETPLESYLRVEEIETILICGFMTNVCVESTARSAHERGFDVILVEDCCASFSKEMHDSTIRNVKLVIGTSVKLEQIKALLRKER